MPRIDPLQLLKCLAILLRSDGGIRSEAEVQRLASLMTKFSKKLVSKCIYIQILKCSETKLLGLFMASGGWALTHMWLTDGILNKNWPLVQELLELLLLCPVNVDLLKVNNCPKLVKGLSRDESHEGVRLLAGKLVEQWLRIVKGEAQSPILNSSPIHNSMITIVNSNYLKNDIFKHDDIESSLCSNMSVDQSTVNNSNIDVQSDDINLSTISCNVAQTINTESIILNKQADVIENNQILPVYKITYKDGKQMMLAKVSIDSSDKKLKDFDKLKERDKKDKERDRDKDRSSNKDKDNRKSSSKSSSSSSRSSGSSSNRRSSSDKSSSSHRSSSSSSRDKDRSRRSSSSKSSSRDKDKEENQTEKDKATLDKLKPPTLDKLGKIPKKARSEDVPKSIKTETKKPSISIEVRKSSGDAARPKTVKTFNSKFRSHGLEEEAKPPPPRPVKKTTTPLLPVISAIKRSSPPRYDIMPPEKKAKIAEIAVVSKPGAIKLIPPKHKHGLANSSYHLHQNEILRDHSAVLVCCYIVSRQSCNTLQFSYLHFAGTRWT